MLNLVEDKYPVKFVISGSIGGQKLDLKYYRRPVSPQDGLRRSYDLAGKIATLDMSETNNTHGWGSVFDAISCNTTFYVVDQQPEYITGWNHIALAGLMLICATEKYATQDDRLTEKRLQGTIDITKKHVEPRHYFGKLDELTWVMYRTCLTQIVSRRLGTRTIFPESK